MTRLKGVGRVTFAALAIPNYRRYVAGQSVSLIGTWMQMAAQSWLVLSITGSATTLGVIVALQTLPVLLLGPYGGVVADRVDKRRLMVILQIAMGVQALILGVLTVTGTVRLWQIGALAALLGLNNAFENPARQSFMLEMVGRREPAQRGHAQLRARQRRARDRPGGRRGADRDRRRGPVLPGERRELRRRRRLAGDARPSRDPSQPAERARAGSAAGGPALRQAHAGAGRAAGDDGARRARSRTSSRSRCR